MKNSNVRNLIRFVGITFFISFLFALSFTFVVNKAQKSASSYADDIISLDSLKVSQKISLEQYYLDSIANEPIYSPWIFFGQKSWTYAECQDSELKLG